jgi:hypothetical protein
VCEMCVGGCKPNSTHGSLKPVAPCALSHSTADGVHVGGVHVSMAGAVSLHNSVGCQPCRDLSLHGRRLCESLWLCGLCCRRCRVFREFEAPLSSLLSPPLFTQAVVGVPCSLKQGDCGLALLLSGCRLHAL